MKRLSLKKVPLWLGVIAFFMGCPEKYYDAPKPVIEAGSEICIMDCVKSSTATKTEWSAEDFISKVLKDPNYLRVTSSHNMHNNDAGFFFEPSLAKINMGHQHGRQKVPFLVKDSTGVWEKSSVEVFIDHDKTPPVVTSPVDLGEIPYGEAVTSAVLTAKILEKVDFSVILNPCALAASKKVTFVDWDYENNVEEETDYPVKFKVKDALGNVSEEKSTKFRYGKNVSGAPSVKQLKPIVLNCDTITIEKVREALDDSEFFTITVAGGRTLVKPIKIQGLEFINAGEHYHNPNLELIGIFRDNSGAITQKAIRVVVEPKDKDRPTSLSLPDNGRSLFSFFVKASPLPSNQLDTLIDQKVKDFLLPAMVKVNSVCAKPGEVHFEVVSHDVNVAEIGEYNIEIKITDSLGFILEGGNRNYKIKVIEQIPDGIPLNISLEGKTLYLTHYDAFKDMEVLKENWDIGNPGYGMGDEYAQYRADSGNEGIAAPTLVTFPEGIRGYSGDRYKQPYWSPKAVNIVDGELEISAFWDPDIENPSGYIPQGVTGVTKGYGLAGAIHSKRQFPCGFFLTKLRHSTDKRAVHWDAFWAESNNPFSRAYGSKELFMPPGAESREKRGKVFTNGQVSNVNDRGLNGEQVYEFDMYEWVSNNASQWQVIHAWSWYGGYPGNEDRSAAGDIQLWSTSDNLRDNDKAGMRAFSKNYNDKWHAKKGESFYLAMLVTPDKIIMWNAKADGGTIEAALQSPVSKSELTKSQGAFENDNISNIWPADEWAPIQVKYSMELGDWGNRHDMIYNEKDNISYEKRDKMFAEFFAFYAWDVDRFTHY